MPGIGDLFKEGSTAEQFLIWGVLQQLLQPLLAPLSTELGKLVYSAAPDVPLSPADAARLVARGLIDHGTGKDIANDNGIGADDFDHLVTGAGSGPDLGAAVAALQRGLIDVGGDQGQDVSFAGALRDAGIRDGWHPILQKLAVQLPSWQDALNADLEGQLSRAEALDWYKRAGGDPDAYQWLYDANGQAPTPDQALTLLNRGIIPERGTGPASVSYEQAFLEGPWRNKWLEPFIALREYYPPPRTVTAMYHDGQLTHEQAAEYLAKQGLSADLAAAYLSAKTTASTSTEKHLAKTDVLALYADKLMSKPEAAAALVALGYSGHDAALIIELEDVRTNARAVSSGVSRARSLYLAGKITETDAEHTLTSLGVSADQARQVVQTWALTPPTDTRTLSASQVTQAAEYGLISATDAMARLESLGYDAGDAWLLLSIRNKGPLTDVPRPA